VSLRRLTSRNSLTLKNFSQRGVEDGYRAKVRQNWCHMNHGQGWVIFEESYPECNRRLLSIMASRRAARDVKAFMEQLYIGRYASIQEQLAFKKSRKSASHDFLVDQGGQDIAYGHDPVFFGICARSIVPKGLVLEFEYRIIVKFISHPLEVTWETTKQSLTVEC
jgi:hypothetical protein